ncbi:MAG: CPBP family intramembrane glutamic endopeptidase [Candidatus Kapaibacterium sp.]
MKNINKTWLFLIITFAISYSIVGIFWLLGGEYKGWQSYVIAVVYMFVPFIAALLVTRVIHEDNIKSNLLIRFKINKWFFAGWLIPVFLALLTFGVSLMMPDVEYTTEMAGMFERFEQTLPADQIAEMKRQAEEFPVHPFWIALLQGLIAGFTINAIAGFGEEAGWRGFMVRQFSNINFFKAALIIGFVWGIWHAPLILQGHNYPEHPQLGVIFMTIWCILLSPLFLYIAIKSGSSVAAAIMHGTLNASAGIPLILIEGGSDLTVGVTGIAGFISLAAGILALYLYDTFITGEKVMMSRVGRYLLPEEEYLKRKR